MRKLLTSFVFTLIISQAFSQKLLDDYFLSTELSYRSYGRNDHVGFGGGIEFSKNIKKWLGVGVNLSYWQDKKKDWDFNNPFTGQNYKYFGIIKDFKTSFFAQIFPVNTKIFAPYIQIGGYTGYYYQEFYLGGYVTLYNPDEFYVLIYDDGYKGLSYGIEIGVGFRFQINNIIIVPSITKTNNSLFFDLDGFDGLNLKIGWNFK